MAIGFNRILEMSSHRKTFILGANSTDVTYNELFNNNQNANY